MTIRPSTIHPPRKIVFVFAIFFAATLARGATTQPTEPIHIVEFAGSATEIGTAHAAQLAEPIHFLFDHYLKPFFKSDTKRFIALTAASAFETHLLPRHAEELQALAKGTNLDERDAMLAQCFLDLMPTVTFPAGASSDGVARFGRNLDFPSLDVADKHTVLMIYHPTEGYQFAAVGWPGLLGVLSGMNEHGLTLANMEVRRPARLPVAMPYTLLYRTILERCKTVDQAIDLLKSTPRQTANNLMLMDAAGNRAVAEITPEAVVVRRGEEKAALMSTNHHRGLDLDTGGMCARYDILHDASKKEFGHIDVKTIESMLARAAHGKMTLQSMVFEPSNRVIYLAVGQTAPTHPFTKIDLAHYFHQ
jgi:isopenicillin-N N-acyltransferase-like protein